jgi:hypothetical protein
MLTCKQVSKALAEKDYQELSFLKRVGLKLHVAICLFCKGYNSNVMLFQDMARSFRKFEESDSKVHAPDDYRNKWKQAIDSATKKQ